MPNLHSRYISKANNFHLIFNVLHNGISVHLLSNATTIPGKSNSFNNYDDTNSSAQ